MTVATYRIWMCLGRRVRALVQRTFPTLDAAIVALDPFHRKPPR